MRYSFALPLAVTALATLASADVFDGTDMEETVQVGHLLFQPFFPRVEMEADTLNTQAQQNTFSGNYSVINVESGEYLAFVADDTGKVGIVTTAEESFVSLNVGSDGDLTGTVISTELGKCASAQYAPVPPFVERIFPKLTLRLLDDVQMASSASKQGHSIRSLLLPLGYIQNMRYRDQSRQTIVEFRRRA